ncbi:MAG: PxKF domain-containing protein [Thermomicrobiaceae bacterium]|nr:PxKF domain-containing protein [Thermomicrobiaceae bacterium]
MVHLTASDGLSGVAATFYAVDGGSPQSGTAVALGEGIHAVSYWSVDKADNVETARTVTVKVDKTAPTTAASVPPPDGANGWYKTRPAVTLSASDALSGVATTYYSLDGGAAQAYAQPVVVGDGIHTLAYWSVDAAGNVETSHSLTLQVDTQGPAITIGGVTGGATYTLGAVPTPSCAATDGGSGLVGGCSGTLTGGTPNGVGTYTYTATATDAAGNTTTVSVTYRVIYRWDGFLQPINDTAHQVGTTTSIFKAGSTVPVKFQLKKADGTVVQANTLPLWLTPAKGSPTTAPADESVYSDPATSGSTYRWDSAAQQYIYNWSTKGAASGYYYRIGVTLDDGQTYYVNIGLR